MACDIIAGPHKLYYAPYGTTGATTYLGMTVNDGITQVRELITDEVLSDQTGQGVVDHIFRGENLTLEFTLAEVNKDIVQRFLHPWQGSYSAGVATGVNQEYYGVAGRLGCSVYGILEAIPLTFTPAEGFTGGSATGNLGEYPGTAGSNPGSGRQYRGLVVGTLSESMDSRGRFIPVRFQCYPFEATVSGVVIKKHWSWITAPSSSISITW